MAIGHLMYSRDGGAAEGGPFENQDKVKKYLVNVCICQALLIPVLKMYSQEVFR